MKILFISDKSQNLSSWINALQNMPNISIRTWSLAYPNRKILSRFMRAINILFAPFEVKKFIDTYKPDLVIGYRIPSYGFISVLSGFNPVVIAAQGASDLWPPDSKILWLKKLIIKFTVKRADMIHVWAKHMAENLIILGAKEEKIFIMPRGIDSKYFFISNEMKNRDHKSIQFVCTRSMYPEYQHDRIIKVLVLLKEKFKLPFKCTFIGSGPLETELMKLSKNLGLMNQIEFLGRVANENIPIILNRSHIYLSFTVTEGLSASLLESMACGCLPIVSDLPGNRELINNSENGFLVNAENAEEIARLIQKVWIEKDLLYRCSKINSDLIKKDYTIYKNMKNFIDIYSTLIKNK